MNLISNLSFYEAADAPYESTHKNVQPFNHFKLCINCGDILVYHHWDKKICSDACRQESKVRVQISSVAYAKLIDIHDLAETIAEEERRYISNTFLTEIK